MAENLKVYNGVEDILEEQGIKHISEEEAMAMMGGEETTSYEEAGEMADADEIAMALAAENNSEPEVAPEVTTEVAPEEPQAEKEEAQAEPERSYKFGQQQEETEAPTTVDEETILKAISDRLGEQFGSFEDIEKRIKSQVQPSVEMDAELETLAKFKRETGRSLDDYILYQSLNTAEMDDLNAVRLEFQMQYPELTAEEREDLISNKYRLDEDVYDEKEVRVSKAQLKVDAARAKREIEKLRSEYTIPKQAEAPQEESTQSIFDDKWLNSASQAVEELDAIEFSVGKDESFKFGIEGGYKQKLKEANKNIESFFDQYINKDGSWNHELFNAHKAAIDNIELIVKEAYNQGLSKGQLKVLATNANANPEPPRGNAQRAENEHKKALQEIFGAPPKMTVRI